MMTSLLPKIIRTYAEIAFQPRSLLVLDIDDTLLYFPTHNKTWWKEMEKTHSREELLHQWREAVRRTTPVVIDKPGFSRMCDQTTQTESSLIFLTARSEIMRHTTYRQLQDHLYPAVSEGQVFFAEKKGPALQQILQTQFPGHNHIIFVDDHPNNHHSVIESFKDSSYTLDAYLFQGEGLH